MKNKNKLKTLSEKKGGRISNVFTVLLPFFQMPQNFPLKITNIFSNLIVEYGYTCKTYCTDPDQLWSYF